MLRERLNVCRRYCSWIFLSWPYKRNSVIHVKLMGNAQGSPCLVSRAQKNSLSELTDMRSPLCGTSALWHRGKGGRRTPWGLWQSCSYCSDPPSIHSVERLQMVDLTYTSISFSLREISPLKHEFASNGERLFFWRLILSHTRNISHVPAWQISLWSLPKGYQEHQMHPPSLSCSLRLNLATLQKAAATLCWPVLFGHSRCRDPNHH